ncbi:hypothetical protein LOTGIDRAFT_155225 [Lottia gigantea]|uniref:dihydrofolate reductase n=1 Tax=Lottia gigantea TaxID=225164 RepID=V3ZI95_LOTGI|nr:hypothetical protein LOTGIDRAFT_155225 [Lottia gigantea]ESO83922.1 hypothetical protein LOTGIDRAFT_155225 [Lottia gigantea]
MCTKRLNIVVAACKNNGIGVNGSIPWRLKKDMAMFRHITSDTVDESKQNAVIMGRKTWMSIPDKFRPLKNRVNIILSNTLSESPDGTYIVKNFQQALSLVNSDKMKQQIESVHIIGGSSVYKEAMESDYDCRVYLTKVDADFECDTFLPPIEESLFQRVKNPSNIPSDVQEENGIQFTYEIYDKTTDQSDRESPVSR